MTIGEPNRDKLLSVDPGKSTGWAIFSIPNLEPEHRGIARSVDEFTDLLIKFGKASALRAVVLEDYIQRGYTNTTGSRMEASQIIGALKFFTKFVGVPIHLQPSSVLPIAQRWSADFPMPKDHRKSHDVSAILHGRYWLINNKYANIPNEGRLLPGEVL